MYTYILNTINMKQKTGILTAIYVSDIHMI